MFTLIKLGLYFSISFCVLSIPLAERPLFDHMYEVFAPLTTQTFMFIKAKSKDGFGVTKKFTKKLFDTTPPDLTDTVKSRPSASVETQVAQEDYTLEERNLLEKVIGENQEPE